MKIPLVDLKANYNSISKEIDNAVTEVLENTSFIKGKILEEFEKNWAELCNADHCIGTSSGTSSLELILKAMNISNEDEVILPSHTFIATSEAIVNCGARPVFADCLDSTALIDPSSVKKCITSKTKAIIIVDLYGQPADHDAILKLTEGRNISIIQDAAQSHLAEYKKQVVGSYSKVTSFSFYPGKNLGAFGDAGAVVTNDTELADKIKMISDHGRISKYEHLINGTNARMDTLQAAILKVKMQHLPEWNKNRRRIVKNYRLNLEEFVSFIDTDISTKPVYHLCVIRTPYRDDLKKFLDENGISTGIHYPIPLHLQPVYKHLGYLEGYLPVTEKIADEILSLPVYPEMTDEQVGIVIESVKQYFK